MVEPLAPQPPRKARAAADKTTAGAISLREGLFISFYDTDSEYRCKYNQRAYGVTLNALPPLITDGTAMNWPDPSTMIIGCAVLPDRFTTAPFSVVEAPVK